jgi:dehydrogenase/reductase SDR family protein 12
MKVGDRVMENKSYHWHTSTSIDSVYNYLAKPTLVSEWLHVFVTHSRTNIGPIDQGSSLRMIPHWFFSFSPYILELLEAKEHQRVQYRIKKNENLIEINFELERNGASTDISLNISYFFSNGAYLTRQFFEYSCDKSVLNLKRVFDQKRPINARSVLDHLGDSLILPALIGITRIGYYLRRAHFPPIDTLPTGKRVLITGAGSGIGQKAALRLAELGAEVILHARSAERLEETLALIESLTGRRDYRCFYADLARFEDIKSFCERINSEVESIDYLVHNAATFKDSYSEANKGLEEGFMVNVVAPYVITDSLINLLINSKARVILVSSAMAYTQKLDCTQLNQPADSFNPVVSYAQGKRALICLAEIWQKHFEEAGLSFHAMHPGGVQTKMLKLSDSSFQSQLRKIMRTEKQGADTIVWMICSHETERFKGFFWHDRRRRGRYIIPGKVESRAERKKLIELLNSYI